MKIERGNTKLWRLSSIKTGEVFQYEDDFFIKTDELVDGQITCVRLIDGHIDWFVGEAFVYRYDAKLVVE